MARYVALLRGINVGGKNSIKMPALKECFQANGFEDVSTYIQSGNVIFSAAGAGAGELASRIEAMLASTFDLPLRVVLRSRAQMRTVVNRAPDGFGSDPARHRYDVIFLRPPLTAERAMKSVSTKPGVDQARPGTGVLYFSRLISKATQSHMSRIIGLPVYQDMTIRNWNTTSKLLALLEG
ncbi:MAG TPA: DUF1697 domain-containing protein [Acidimicrobiia bacterium]|nr:DUF1697 domain-containing protein [Acidimicrobiia bacterium]